LDSARLDRTAALGFERAFRSVMVQREAWTAVAMVEVFLLV
jgi:hypothetical protein